jgi:hypothetical protein
MLCSNWLGLIAPGNQDVGLETNPNQMNPLEDSYIGFPRAPLLREGTISFDFLVACIGPACVINKLTQHLQLRLTQCLLPVSDWLRAKRTVVRGQETDKGDTIHYSDYPPSVLHSSSAGSQKNTDVTQQALCIHCSAENFLINLLKPTGYGMHQ